MCRVLEVGRGSYSQEEVPDDSNERVRRLMRELNLIPVQTMTFKATTNSKHSLPVAPNLLQKDFTASAPCQKWVVDITYVHT
jgi:putative transposase